MLNVLTILTFVACGIFFLLQLYSFANSKKIYDMAMASQQNIDRAPAFVRKMAGPDPIGQATRNYENRVPIFVLGVVCLALCTYGAIQMRKLKKLGFYVYCIGEIVLPLLTMAIFTGTSVFSGLGFMFGILFYVLFVILYATQLKYMKA
jgi:hypothetical protein